MVAKVVRGIHGQALQMQGVPVYLCKAYRTLGLTHFLALN